MYDKHSGKRRRDGMSASLCGCPKRHQTGYVEVMEQAHLDGLTRGWEGGETHVTEVYGNWGKVLWLHSCPNLQSFSHRPGGMGSFRVTRYHSLEVRGEYSVRYPGLGFKGSWTGLLGCWLPSNIPLSLSGHYFF